MSTEERGVVRLIRMRQRKQQSYSYKTRIEALRLLSQHVLLAQVTQQIGASAPTVRGWLRNSDAVREER